MTEADFQTKFNKWVKHNMKQTAVFELKLVKEKSLAFSRVLPHQLDSLKIAKSYCLPYKIPDGFNGGQKPFDSFTICNCKAYIVVMFYKRGQKEFIMIDIDDFIHEIESSNRKSLTEDRAKILGQVGYFA
jgi:hypothetical protein